VCGRNKEKAKTKKRKKKLTNKMSIQGTVVGSERQRERDPRKIRNYTQGKEHIKSIYIYIQKFQRRSSI
jgi:Zn-dependent alcohol dehydrogenase